MGGRALRQPLGRHPGELSHELTTVLARDGVVRVERIVSRGHTSPPGFWYDQDEEEIFTAPAEDTIWFAVFYRARGSAGPP
jgi:hypothetical protein